VRIEPVKTVWTILAFFLLAASLEFFAFFAAVTHG